jgi:hypothetical protein
MIMPTLGTILKMTKNNMIIRAWELTNFFMKEQILLGGSVGKRYKGSSYCSGVLFGIYGGRLLVIVG